MSTEGDIVDNTTTTIHSCNSAPTSPKNKLKFFCSHGGKIHPHPADGHLKYVGGETRIISAPRDITFKELMKKMTYLIDGEMVLKYQLLVEDLDALVTVRTDEDLRHMFNEYERYEVAAAPRLKAFLFPANPTPIENQTESEHQHYLDAINGIIRGPTPRPTKPCPSNTIGQPGNLVHSACSSPKSPDSCTTETQQHEIPSPSPGPCQSCHQTGGVKMHRVKSSPSICNLNMPQHYQNLAPSPLISHQLSKPPIDPNWNGVVQEKLIPVRSIGRGDGVTFTSYPYNYYATPRHHRGGVCCARCKHYDDCNHGLDRRMVERSGSPSMSPVTLSPQHGYSIFRAWDN